MTGGDLLTLIYRGPLASCNYGCRYCPFAKRVDTAAQLRRDQAALRRFVDRVIELSAESQPLRVLFTPWGEALTRRWYRNAIGELSQHLARVAVQTNLTCGTAWLSDTRTDRVGFWASWHPSETSLESFVQRVCAADACGASVSAGTVISADRFDHALALREALPEHVPTWLNPEAPRRHRFADEVLTQLETVDPLLRQSLTQHRPLGLPCEAGERSLTVDGQGALRRCHFTEPVIGNLYHADWPDALQPRLCPKGQCNCYLGYAQLPHLPIRDAMGDGLLERHPGVTVRPATVSSATTRKRETL